MPAETKSARTPARRDLACGLRGALIWWLPTVALIVLAGDGVPYLVAVWPPVLLFMGTMCLANARRCGRTHCFATGPFFLLLALVSLLYGLGVVPLGGKGWDGLAWTLLAGSLALTYGADELFGRYRRRAPIE